LSSDLRADLAERVAGRTCVVGIGDRYWGDDGLGVVLAEALQARNCPNVLVTDNTPENWIGRIAQGGFDRVLLLDAVEHPGEAGSVVLLESGQLRSRFPQVSTHKLSLGTLATLIQNQCRAEVWCLGVKPASLAPGTGLSQPVKTTLQVLEKVLLEVLTNRAQAVSERRNELR